MRRKRQKKTDKVIFTLRPYDKARFMEITNSLINDGIIKNRTGLFEDMIMFLGKSTNDEVLNLIIHGKRKSDEKESYASANA